MDCMKYMEGFFESPKWLRTAVILLVVDWAIGITFVQYFYYRTRKLRHLDPRIKETAFPFINSVEKWNRLAHSFYSVLMLPRVLLFIFTVLTLPILVRLVLLGSGAQISGWRQKAIKILGGIYARFALFSTSFVWTKYRNDHIDYSPWLGETKKSVGRPPIIIANHRACTLKAICDRASEIKANESVPPIAIFPEGGTSSGSHLLRFKKGAFEPLEPIQPFFIEYYSPYCNPACEVIPMHLHIMFMACQPFSVITLRRMPVVYFTESMLNKGKGQSPSEAYADTVRDIYSATYGIKKVDNSLMEKVKLNQYLYNSNSDNPATFLKSK